MTAIVQDYPSLVQAVADFAHRSDILNYQDYFIQFGQLRLVRDILKNNFGSGVKWQEISLGSLTIDPTTGWVPLPPDFIGLKAMQVTDGAGDVFDLEYEDSEWIYTNYPQRVASGLPAYVAREGTNFIFGPFPDSAYGISGTYYGQGVVLSSTNPTNWMTTYCPDVILAACMVELQPFLKSADGGSMWASFYKDKLDGLIAADMADKLAPGNLVIGVE